MKPAAADNVDVPASNLDKAGEVFLAQIHDSYWNADKLITSQAYIQRFELAHPSIYLILTALTREGTSPVEQKMQYFLAQENQ